jgi:hypothetical protein
LNWRNTFLALIDLFVRVDPKGAPSGVSSPTKSPTGGEGHHTEKLPGRSNRHDRATPRGREVAKKGQANTSLEKRELWIWLGGLAAIVLVFGFCTELLEGMIGVLVVPTFEHFGLGFTPHVEHWQGWELGALVWNAGFVTWFFWSFPFPQHDKVVRRIVVFLALVIILTILASITIWRCPYFHVFLICAIALVFTFIDKLLADHLPEGEHKRDFVESLYLADIPMLAAFAFLALYQIWQFIHSHATSLDVFFGGAISFQFVASTVIFAMIQARIFRTIGSNLTPAVVAALPRKRPEKGRQRQRNKTAEANPNELPVATVDPKAVDDR